MGTTARTRIKVDRERLIEKIRERKSEADEQYAADLAAFKAAQRVYPKEVAAFLSSLAAGVRAGTIEPSDALYRWRSDVPTAPRSPSPVSEHYAEAIAQLDMGADDTVTITGDDFARYLR